MNEKIQESKKAVLAYKAAKVVTVIYIVQKCIQFSAIILDLFNVCVDLSYMPMMSDETYVASLGAIYAIYNVGNMGEHASKAYKEKSHG